MPKYLIQASYTSEGAKGVLKDGGTRRHAMVKEMADSLGGSLEAFYYAFGDTDVYIVINTPDDISIAAASLVLNASGAVTSKTTVLLTPEEVDQATKMVVEYRPPGQ